METSIVLRILIRNCLPKWLLVRLKKKGRVVFRWIIESEFLRTVSELNEPAEDHVTHRLC